MASIIVCSAVSLFAMFLPGVAETNVYGKSMEACGSSHAGGCSYVSYDAGAHEVCVTNLPEGFSSDTGQGAWSDRFTGQPWCICIWAYSNYILQKKNLALKCESIPAKVLEEKYSLDKFKQCGKMASKNGCGPEDIRRSIQSLCKQCDQQAPDGASKSALKSKCDAILESAPAAPMGLYEEASSASVMPRLQGASSPQALFSGISCLVMAVVSATMLVRSFRRSQGRESTQDQEIEIDVE